MEKHLNVQKECKEMTLGEYINVILHAQKVMVRTINDVLFSGTIGELHKGESKLLQRKVRYVWVCDEYLIIEVSSET